MEAFRKLFKRDDEEDQEAPLTSEIIVRKGAVLTLHELKLISGFAMHLIDLEKRSPAEKEWIKDFIHSVDDLFVANADIGNSLDAKYQRQSRREEMIASTSAQADARFEEAQAASRAQARASGGEGRSLSPPRGFENQRTSRLTSPIRAEAGGGRPLPALPAVKMNELAIRPDCFRGKKEFARRWIEEYELAADSNGWGERLAIKYFPTFLRDAARDWYTSIVQPNVSVFTSWLEVKGLFLRYYVGPDERAAVKEEIKRCRQAKDEPATDFIARLMRLMSMVYTEKSEYEKVKKIREKLSRFYQDKLIGHHPTTLMALNDICLEIEKSERANSHRFPANSNHAAKPDLMRPAPTVKRFANQYAKLTRPPTAFQATSSKPTTSNIQRQMKKCSYCSKLGHTVDDCWAKQNKSKKQPALPAGPYKPMLTAPAEEKQVVIKKPQITTIKDVSGVVARAGDGPEALKHPVQLNGRSFEALMDTGSRLSLLNANVALELNLVPDNSEVGLVGANSEALRCLGLVEVKLAIKIGPATKMLTTQVVVVENLCVPILMGWELMGWLEILINPGKKKIWFEENATGVQVAKEALLPPRSESVLTAVVPRQIPPGTEIIMQSFPSTKSILVANGISEVSENHEVECLVANLEPKTLKLEQGLKIASYEVREQDPAEKVGAVHPLGRTSETVKVGDQLSEVQVSQLLALLKRQVNAFSVDGKLGETRLIEHDIVLEPDTQPIVEPMRRRPLTHRLEAQRQVDKMLQEGVIERSSSPWASAYVLVKKKTGDMRLCIDFRKLNAKTKKCVFPLPNVEDCLEPLSGNQFFSQLDMASGYWQIRMAERAKEMTAFRTECDLYQFRRMPFGLCNAPASFQRLVNALFANLKGVHLQVFIDDICVATKTWEEHLKMLEEVLELVIRANLKLKASKCTFAAARVIFLGHELSYDGIRQDPDKVKAIRELPAPKNVKEIRQALGLFGYYRRFVENFAHFSEPLTRLMRKDQVFEWTAEQQKSFDALKEALCRNPVLAHFNHNDPLALKTDASGKGVACILLQFQKGDWHLITCCSRRLSEAEESYGITDLEGLALIYGVTKLRNYILGKPVKVIVDHCALCAMKEKKLNTPRHKRWAILLSEFDLTIVYTKGRLHSDVDCLSRAPVDDAPDYYLDDKVLLIKLTRSYTLDEVINAVTMPLNEREWRSLSESDEEAKPHYEKARRRVKGYKIFNGCLYYENRLYVPSAKRKETLNAAHADEPAAHGGFRATVERMQKLWWPSMADDARKFVESCRICQARKAERQLPAGEMYSFDACEPMQLVALDALEVQASLSGKRYVFIAIDCFSRYVDGEAVEDVRGETFAKFLRTYVGRFGAPRTILTDNAPTMVNEHVKKVCSVYHIEHRKSTPHHHRGNAPAERAIQTVQEKLSLITHDPTSSVDWEDALAGALLSINTTVNSTTKYSPYELMFSRECPTRTDEVVEDASPQDLFHELATARRHRMHADAIATQASSREAQKQAFNRKHRARELEEGSMVWAKTIGRRSKLQNRFQGPYRITKKNNDIYTLESVDGRKEKLERHVGDLKPYVEREMTAAESDTSFNESASEPLGAVIDSGYITKRPEVIYTTSTLKSIRITSNSQVDKIVLSIISISINVNKSEGMRSVTSYFLLVLIVSPASGAASPAFEFEEAPVVIWRPTRSYVSGGVTSYKLLIKFGEMCPILNQFRLLANAAELDSALAYCGEIFRQQITNRVGQLMTGTGGVAHAILPHTQLTSLVNSLNQPPQVHQYRDNNAIPGAQIIQPPKLPLNGPVQAGGAQRGMAIKPQGGRQRRGLTDFFLGTFASNILDTVLDRVLPNKEEQEIKDREHFLEKAVAQLNSATNLTALQMKALNEQMMLQGQLVEHNVQTMANIMFNLPALTFTVADMVTRMHITGALIDKVHISFRARRPDVDALFAIFKHEPLLNVDPQSIYPESVRLTSPGVNLMQVEFTGVHRDENTRLYAVSTVRYWGDLLTGKPKLFEYTGPRHVIYNEGKDCVQGIRNVENNYVTVQCLEENFRDPTLKLWRVVTEGELTTSNARRTEIMEAWPKVIIACYGERITMKQGEYECPPVPFKLPATLAWSTPTYNYSANVVDVEANVTWPLLDRIITKAHFGQLPIARSVDALERVHQLNKQLDAVVADMSVGVGEYKVSYKHSTIGLSAIVAFIMLMFISTLLIRGRRVVKTVEDYRNEQKALNNRYRKRAFSEGIYASPGRPPMITMV